MIVVDASVLVNALVDVGPLGDAGRQELSRDPEWAAPEHLLVEAISAVRRMVHRHELSERAARNAVDDLRSLSVLAVETALLLDRMWQLRATVSGYDAPYVAAAEALRTPLVTGDGRLSRASGPRCEIRLAVPT